MYNFVAKEIDYANYFQAVTLPESTKFELQCKNTINVFFMLLFWITHNTTNHKDDLILINLGLFMSQLVLIPPF